MAAAACSDALVAAGFGYIAVNVALDQMAVIRRMAMTFEKRDWGSGRETWRPAFGRRRMLGPSRYVLRRLSNKLAKRADLRLDVCLY